ncbi:hypothetical protein [Nitrosophilus labii]|uniref:hypothetical protein n=1 Tax=Nitrosophilus labii TaxID=2706014 RepID=UPI001656EC5A|nr:hypothetical protein [Nitrosophilus labii]
MKKIVILLVLVINLIASVTKIEKEIYSTILKALFPQKKIIKIWVDNHHKKKLFRKINLVKLTNNYKNADILFVYNTKTLKDEKRDKAIIFVGKYTLLKDYQDRVIGGFFWQKGRPNIIFLRKNLEKFNITLPSNFEKYIEDRV